MSLASSTAKTASNMNLAMTLNWLIAALEKKSEPFEPKAALDAINDHLSSLERTRLQHLEEARLKAENNSGRALAL